VGIPKTKANSTTVFNALYIVLLYLSGIKQTNLKKFYIDHMVHNRYSEEHHHLKLLRDKYKLTYIDRTFDQLLTDLIEDHYIIWALKHTGKNTPQELIIYQPFSTDDTWEINKDLKENEIYTLHTRFIMPYKEMWVPPRASRSSLTIIETKSNQSKLSYSSFINEKIQQMQDQLKENSNKRSAELLTELNKHWDGWKKLSGNDIKKLINSIRQLLRTINTEINEFNKISFNEVPEDEQNIEKYDWKWTKQNGKNKLVICNNKPQMKCEYCDLQEAHTHQFTSTNATDTEFKFNFNVISDTETITQENPLFKYNDLVEGSLVVEYLHITSFHT